MNINKIKNELIKQKESKFKGNIYHYSQVNFSYNSILHIDKKEIIKNIVKKEKEKLLFKTQDLAGFCKYIANQIECELKEKSITAYYIDLNEIVGIDHVFLIAEYMSDKILKRILIDPTISQFVKSEEKQLLKLQNWPSEKMDSEMLENLLKNGMVEIDNWLFNNYINSFNSVNQNINLDEYLLEKRLGKIK